MIMNWQKGSVMKYLCFGHIMKKRDTIGVTLPWAFFWEKYPIIIVIFWWPSFNSGPLKAGVEALSFCCLAAVPVPFLSAKIYFKGCRTFSIVQPTPTLPKHGASHCPGREPPTPHLLNNALLRRPEKVRPAFDNAPQSAYLSTYLSLE